MTPEERQHRIREVAERLAEQWPEDGADINDLEDFAEQRSARRETNPSAPAGAPRPINGTTG